MAFEDEYVGEKTGITATVDLDDYEEQNGLEVEFSEDFDGPLYPGVAGEEMQDLAEELYTEEDHFEALYVSDGNAYLIFPDDDQDKAEQVVEKLVENVDHYYDKLGDAGMEAYLGELPEEDL